MIDIMVLFPFRTSLVGVPLLIHPLVRLSSLRIPVVPKQSWGWALTLCHLQFTPHGHPKAPSLTLTSTYMLLPPPITQNESLSDNVQITPQAVSLRVRPGETGRHYISLVQSRTHCMFAPSTAATYRYSAAHAAEAPLLRISMYCINHMAV